MKKLFLIIIFVAGIFASDLMLYNTKNISKAKGLDMDIRVPDNYFTKETYRPNVALKFINKNDYDDMIMVLVYKNKEFLNLAINQHNKDEFCMDGLNELKTLDPNAKSFSCDLVYIETLPAISQTTSTTMKRVDFIKETFDRSIYFFYNDYCILVIFYSDSLAKLENSKATQDRILNSIVINSLYANWEFLSLFSLSLKSGIKLPI